MHSKSTKGLTLMPIGFVDLQIIRMYFSTGQLYRQKRKLNSILKHAHSQNTFLLTHFCTKLFRTTLRLHGCDGVKKVRRRQHKNECKELWVFDDRLVRPAFGQPHSCQCGLLVGQLPGRLSVFKPLFRRSPLSSVHSDLGQAA